jgi:hypothetical protein
MGWTWRVRTLSYLKRNAPVKAFIGTLSNERLAVCRHYMRHGLCAANVWDGVMHESFRSRCELGLSAELNQNRVRAPVAQTSPPQDVFAANKSAVSRVSKLASPSLRIGRSEKYSGVPIWKSAIQQVHHAGFVLRRERIWKPALQSQKTKQPRRSFGAVCNLLRMSGKQSYRFSTTRGAGLIISS